MSDERIVGKVFLVGAGPGDSGLVTRRGAYLIEQADVIIYDRLVGSDILDLAADSTELINVGKTPGKSSISQSNINNLLIDEAKKGKTVVRLKGGDPFVFGRGAEEAAALSEQGINFEVVSGVTSAIAGPGSAGIPVTDRGKASYFTVVTASESPGKTDSDINWDAIAKGNETVIVLMGSKNIDEISKVLIEGGREPSTPAAIVESATMANQREIFGMLANIGELAALSRISAPCVLVIGEVVDSAKKLQLRTNFPLLGKRILVTRSRDQASKLSLALRDLGARVVELPTIAIGPIDDYTDLDVAIGNLSDYEWVIFSSVNAVNAFYSRLTQKGLDSRHFAEVKIGAIGPATCHALSLKGIAPDFIPPRAVSDSLISNFPHPRSDVQKILLPSPKVAPETIKLGLGKLGWSVHRVEAYRTVIPKESIKKAELILNEGLDMVTFTSSSTVTNLDAMIESGIPSDVYIACIGPVTAKTACDKGMKPDIIAEEHTIDGLVSAITFFYSS